MMLTEWIEANIPEDGYSNLPNQTDRQEIPTLAQAGIDYHDSPKFRILANIPEEGAKGLIQEHLQATENSRLTLSDAGIDRNDSPKFRVLANIPEEGGNPQLTQNGRLARLCDIVSGTWKTY